MESYYRLNTPDEPCEIKSPWAERISFCVRPPPASVDLRRRGGSGLGHQSALTETTLWLSNADFSRSQDRDGSGRPRPSSQHGSLSALPDVFAIGLFELCSHSRKPPLEYIDDLIADLGRGEN